ncbi:hypothetical protein ABZ471_01380 [Streptomyces sp. NPDC005728]|uniref:hypothetical protein n=1 Tax=Streptomyces sp. NPDC005728 TaxID=3157054 RepID=UPI0033EED76C
MSAVVEEVVQPCPQCGAEIRGDNRFTPWCAGCDWNVDPTGPAQKPGRLERARRAFARRACLLIGEPEPGAVTSDDDRARSIATELTEARQKVARQILRDGVPD